MKPQVKGFIRVHVRAFIFLALVLLNAAIYGGIVGPLIDARARQLIEMRGSCLCPDDN